MRESVALGGRTSSSVDLETNAAAARATAKSSVLTRKVAQEAVLAVFSEFIQVARGPCKSLALSLADLGELIYVAPHGDKGLGASLRRVLFVSRSSSSIPPPPPERGTRQTRF